jgi:hypothetical protein
VLQGPTLLKYDAATLKQAGSLDLSSLVSTTVGPPPPAAFLISEGNVLVVIGDLFVRVDAASLEVKAKGTLPTVEMGRPGPAALELHGTTLYVVRCGQILAINIEDGKVIAQGTLPAPPAPPEPPDRAPMQ